MGGVRSKLKWISVAVAVVFLQVAGAGVYMVVWACTAKPRAHGDSRPAMRALMNAGPPLSDDAWEKMQFAWSGIDALDAEIYPRSGEPGEEIRRPVDYDELREADPRRPELQLELNAIMRLRSEGVSDALLALGSLPPARPTLDVVIDQDDRVSPLWRAIVEHARAIRRCQDVACAEMRLAAIDGNPVRAVAFLRSLAALNRSQTSVPYLFGLVSFRLEADETGREIAALAAEGLLPAEQIREAISLLSPLATVDLARFVDGEAIIFEADLDADYAPAIIGEWFIRSVDRPFMNDPIDPPHVLHDWITASESRLWMLNLWSPLIPERRTTTHEWRMTWDELLKHAASEPSMKSFDAEAFAKQRLDRYSFVKSLVPAYSKLCRSGAETTSRINGWLTVLAVELYRCERGSLPMSLEDLVPGCIAELPRDPFAPDDRYRYRRVPPGADPAGRTYAVYSLWLNGVDDGGFDVQSGGDSYDDEHFDTVRMWVPLDD